MFFRCSSPHRRPSAKGGHVQQSATGTDSSSRVFPLTRYAIEFSSVSRLYPAAAVTALEDINLGICRGEFLAVVGPSGSGKTTLLNLMCGLDRPTRGRILVNAAQPQSAQKWARLRATDIGFVFQSFQLLPAFTALENVQIPMFGVINSRAQRIKVAQDLLHRVGLDAKRHRYPDELSSGEKQRVAIARSLANNPSILLADEPTGNLDSKSSEGVMNLLKEVSRAKRLTLIMVTHNSSIARHADRVVELFDGRIVSIT